MANSVDPDQTATIGAVCSGSALFASILNLSVMLGKYLQQTTSVDDIFRCIFLWRFKGFKFLTRKHKISVVIRQFSPGFSSFFEKAITSLEKNE